MGTLILGVSGRRRTSRRAIGAGRLEFGERVVERLDVEIASPAPTHLREVTLNRAVAVAMVRGPRAGLELLDTLDTDDRLAGHHRLEAVRAHLQEMAGDHGAARSGYRAAARRTASLPERRYLEARAARLAKNGQNSAPPT